MAKQILSPFPSDNHIFSASGCSLLNTQPSRGEELIMLSVCVSPPPGDCCGLRKEATDLGTDTEVACFSFVGCLHTCNFMVSGTRWEPHSGRRGRVCKWRRREPPFCHFSHRSVSSFPPPSSRCTCLTTTEDHSGESQRS